MSDTMKPIPSYWDIPIELYERLRRELGAEASARFLDTLCGYYFMRVEPAGLTPDEARTFMAVRPMIDASRDEAIARMEEEGA